MLRFLAHMRGRLKRREPPWIEPADLERRLATGDAPLVLDVRSPDEFDGPLGHIAEAVNLPLIDLPARLAELISSRQPVVFVCLTDKRSWQAAAALTAAGRGDVAVLRGGMRRWRDQGFGDAALSREPSRTDAAR
jgi:rhodanese-related sulfurtransferase